MRTNRPGSGSERGQAMSTCPAFPLRVIGDIHGNMAAFADLIAPAHAEGRFILQLGDLVDRGPDSAGCLRAALALCRTGEGVFLRGNHDDKLARLLQGHDVTVRAELARTKAQIDAAPDAASLIADFMALWAHVPWWLRVGDHVFVHGAFHPAMLDHAGPAELHPRSVRKKAEWLAISGEGKTAESESLPQRTYDWVETIPAGLTVVVGHDVRSETAPLVQTNAAGGRAVFLDTGCGKGGPLSWIDIDADGREHIGTRAQGDG